MAATRTTRHGSTDTLVDQLREADREGEAAFLHAAPHEAADSLSPDGDAALRLWVILSRAHSAIAAHAADDVARHGLTLAEFGILEALFHRGPMLLGEVQRRILVSSGGITFLVDRLAAKGLVERRSCPTDRRARYAALTPEGQRLLAEIFPAHADALTRVMAGLSTHDKQGVADLIRALGLYAARLPRSSAAADPADQG